MTSRVLLRRTLLLPALCLAFAACSDDNNGGGTGPGSFTLGTPASAAVTLAAGQATTVSIPVTFTGDMEPVTLTADSVPAGVHVGFQPSVISRGTEVVTVSVSVDPGTAAMNKTVKIVAKAEGMTDQVARIQVTTTASPSYTLTSPNSSTAGAVQIQRGFTGTATVDLARLGFTGPVDIITDALATGITVTPVNNVTGNSATLTISAAPNAATGAGSFTVRSINPTMGDRTVTVRYNVLPEYTLTSPATTLANAVQITRGSSGTTTVTINRATYMGPITLQPSGLATGITVPAVADVAGNSATITINTADNALADTGSFLLSGKVAGMQDQAIRIRYKVNAPPGVQIAAPANFAVIQGIPSSLPVTVNREGGYTGGVTVTLSNLPTGVTAAPVTSASGSTVDVPLTVAADAPAGTSNITVTVTGTGIATKTATTALKVQSTTLTSGVAVTNVADARARGALTYYKIVVPAGTTKLQINMAGGTGDGDIYVIPGVADIGEAVDGSFNAGNNESVTIDNPTAGDWYIAIEVWDPYAGATLTATLTPATAGTVSALRAAASTSSAMATFQTRLSARAATKR